MSTILLPLTVDRVGILQAPFPLEPDEWERMLRILEAMKPALVAEQPHPTASGEQPHGEAGGA